MIDQLSTRVSELKQILSEHPVYSDVTDHDGLKLFMERHVLCVFDFMSLLKSLQRDLTCVDIPWIPREDTQASWLVNSIVVDEESDSMPDGTRASHFEWYLAAMEELGADTGPARSFIKDLQNGARVHGALERHGFPKEAIRFTRRTLSFLDAPLHVRAAVFFHGREDVIPRMFMPLVDRLDEEQVPCGLLKAYLERHIEADGDVHGPKAIELLDRLHAGDQQKISESLHSSVKALEARLQLWDSVHEVLQPGSAV